MAIHKNTAIVILACVTLLLTIVSRSVFFPSEISVIQASYLRNSLNVPEGMNRKEGSNLDIMTRLSNKDTFLPAMSELYERYGKEIADQRIVMKKWCQLNLSCKMVDFEIEMIYMLVRETKPKNIFEMAPNKGFSTHWILQALALNDGDTKSSRLTSVDIRNTSLATMDQILAKRWTFKLGSYDDLLDNGSLKMDDFDFIFIDALHTEEFERGYAKRLLAPHKRKAMVAIHDIVGDQFGGGRESSAVYIYMAFAKNIADVFSLSHYGMPTLLDPVEAGTEKVNHIRANNGVIPPCTETSCQSQMYEALHHRAPSAPTIFFNLNKDQE